MGNQVPVKVPGFLFLFLQAKFLTQFGGSFPISVAEAFCKISRCGETCVISDLAYILLRSRKKRARMLEAHLAQKLYR